MLVTKVVQKLVDADMEQEKLAVRKHRTQVSSISGSVVPSICAELLRLHSGGIKFLAD